MVAGSAGLLGSLMPWLDAHASSSTSVRTGWELAPLGHITAVAAVAVVVVSVLGGFGVVEMRRRWAVAAATMMGVPALLFVASVDAANSALPSWLQRLADSSDLLEANTGSGVLLVVGASLVALVGSVVRLPTPRRATWGSFPTITAVALPLVAVTLLVLRSQPWFILTVALDGSGAEDGTGVGVRESDLAVSDLGFLGIVTLLLTIVLIVVATLSIRRVSEPLVILGGIAAGMMMWLSWLARATSGAVDASLVGLSHLWSEEDIVRMHLSSQPALTTFCCALMLGLLATRYLSEDRASFEVVAPSVVSVKRSDPFSTF